MPGTPLLPNPELDALEDQRADLAVQISVLSDKGTVDQHTISELRRQLSDLERRVAASRRRFH
jgi:predicted  nucleic acid-binding Zn-ribbon protein